MIDDLAGKFGKMKSAVFTAVSGYTMEEKMVIAKRYLLPRQITQNGITDKQIVLEDPILEAMISEYTREAGLRMNKSSMPCQTFSSMP